MSQVLKTPQVIQQNVRWRTVILSVLLAGGLTVTGLMVASAWLRGLSTSENLVRTQLELWY